jgi:hypothetical protein
MSEAELYREMLQIALAQVHEAGQRYAALARCCQALEDELRRYIAMQIR